jgi:hypothetical protein
MAKQEPHELYLALASKLRTRIEFAEQILAIPAHTSQIVETVSLQGRKSVETIAYMTLVATEHGFGRANMPKDVKSHWNAETVFERLKRKGLNLVPSPQRVSRSEQPGIKLECTGIAEHRLNYDDLIAIYRTFHKGLHEPNPYVQADDSDFYTGLIPALRKCIERIKNLTWQHMIFIRGLAFLCVMRNDQGNVVVFPLQKTADLPDDAR